MSLRNTRALTFFAALVLTGCATASPVPAPPEPPDPIVAPSLLAAVPADATWVLALPDVTWDSFDATVRPLAEKARAVHPLLVELLDLLVTDGAVPDAAATLAAVARALPVVAELRDGERLAALGVRFPTALVLHGAPIWPVVRLALADPARARAELDRYLATLPGVSRADVPGGVAWTITVDVWVVKVAVVGEQLVVAGWTSVAGGGVSDAVFAAPSAVAGGPIEAALRAALDQTGGRPDLAVAFVDTGSLAGLLVAGLLADLEVEDAAEARELVACRGELGRLAKGLPRLAFGYQAWTPEASSPRASVDLGDPELAAAVASLGQGGAALAVEPWETPYVSASLSLDVGKLGDLLGLLARRMAGAGYTCPQVRELGDELANAAMQVGVSGRLLLGGLHSLHARVGFWDRAAPSALAPLTAQVVAVAIHDHPEQLMALLQRFAGIEVELPSDGQTVVVAQTPKVFVGRAGPLLGVAVGGPAEVQLGRVLAGGIGGPAPLLSYAIDPYEEDGDPGLVALIDETIEAAPLFPDGARTDGDIATVGGTAVTTARVYARAVALASELDAPEEEADPPLRVAYDAAIERELVVLALRAAREPTLADATPEDDAGALAARRLERLGKLRISGKQLKARYEEIRARFVKVEREDEAPPLDEIAPMLEGLIASERVTAERERLVALQRKRTKIVERYDEVYGRVLSHWGAVGQLRDAVEELFAPTGPGLRLSSEVRVRDGRIEILGATGPATSVSAEPEAPGAE